MWSPARRALGIRRPFGDDTVAYFTERLDVATTRAALTAAGARGPVGAVVGQHHKLAALAVVGGALVLPVDVEPYGPGDSEAAASLRLLGRAVTALGPRFAQYVLGDGLYATAPFLNAVGDRGLRAVVRLKANLPTLFAAAQARFTARPPSDTFDDHGDHVELWDADDFDPWADLRWRSVRARAPSPGPQPADPLALGRPDPHPETALPRPLPPPRPPPPPVRRAVAAALPAQPPPGRARHRPAPSPPPPPRQPASSLASRRSSPPRRPPCLSRRRARRASAAASHATVSTPSCSHHGSETAVVASPPLTFRGDGRRFGPSPVFARRGGSTAMTRRFRLAGVCRLLPLQDLYPTPHCSALLRCLEVLC